MIDANDVRDWNDRPIPTARSRGGVLAVANVNDNLMHTGITAWPTAAITQKLVAAGRESSFDAQEWRILTEHLGHYCDLQSSRSEDAITWSWFGTLAAATPERRAVALNWLVERFESAPCSHATRVLDPGAQHNTACAISLWRRIPHPDTMGSGGPELDAMLVGDRCVVYVEAKWRSPEGRRQGVRRDKTQMQMRREFLERYGRTLYGDRTFVVLSVSTTGDIEATVPADSATVATRALTWGDLAAFLEHPQQEEFARYLAWKTAISGRRRPS